MTLTKYGVREWGLASAAAAVLVIAAIWMFFIQWQITAGIILAVAVIMWIGIAGFFRSPRRAIPKEQNLILSPADGTVKDIEEVEFDMEPFNGKALRVGIFLSVFNVHLNRAPAQWLVTNKIYREGRYLDARNPQCARENEAMTLSGTATVENHAFPMAVRQISGAIARRIVCPVQPGEPIPRGGVYGMIKFGSRTELYLPVSADFQLNVKIGDKVKAGSSVIAVFNPSDGDQLS